MTTWIAFCVKNIVKENKKRLGKIPFVKLSSDDILLSGRDKR